MTRVAIYARYSSDNQRDASIEDQQRLCREHAEQQGWQVAHLAEDPIRVASDRVAESIAGAMGRSA